MVANGNIIFLSNASVLMRLGTESASANREYNGTCNAATVEVTAGDENTVVTLDGVRHTRVGVSGYALHLAYFQDWTGSGLSQFLFNNEGLAATVAVKATTDPLDTNHPQIEGTVILVAGNYGGEAETWAEGDVVLPFVQKPVLRTALSQELMTLEDWMEGVDWRPSVYPPKPISAVLPDAGPVEASESPE